MALTDFTSSASDFVQSAAVAPTTPNTGASLSFIDKLGSAALSLVPVAVSAWSKNQETEAEIAQYKAAGLVTPTKSTTKTAAPVVGSGFALSPMMIIGAVVGLVVVVLVFIGLRKK